MYCYLAHVSLKKRDFYLFAPFYAKPPFCDLGDCPGESSAAEKCANTAAALPACLQAGHGRRLLHGPHGPHLLPPTEDAGIPRAPMTSQFPPAEDVSAPMEDGSNLTVPLTSSPSACPSEDGDLLYVR
jgi:hypothetical protein